ncbi:hypothetical protein [Amycolatopsis sp. lyj-84]|uniref:hypothetical protein n=1 Tax=Amycolatopsis sp. lyj-84 TaxID=2789284 RepID=UPI00397A1A56
MDTWRGRAATRDAALDPAQLASPLRLPVTGGGHGRHRRYSKAELTVLARMRQLVTKEA